MNKLNGKLIITAVFCSLLLGGASLVLGGCGSQEETDTLEAAFAAVEALDYETALAAFDDAAQEGGREQQAARGRGIALLGLTRYEEAAESLIHALSYSDERVDEFDYDTNYYLATAYYKMGQYAQAEAVYSAILGLKEEVDAYYLRGIVRLDLADKESAMSDFDQALALSEGNHDLRIDIFCAMEERGYKEDGMAYLQAALGNADTKMSAYEKGRFSYYMEDYENARNYLEEAKVSGEADTILLLGKTYEKLGDYNYAASIYSNYLSDKGENLLIYNQLGVCKMSAGAYEEALQVFQKALSLEQTQMTQTLRFNELIAYEYMGEFDQALILLREYMADYPDDREAAREYEFLVSR